LAKEVGKGVMKHVRILYVVMLWSVLIGGSLAARDVQETVLRAHKLFEQGSIDQALELYDSIEKKGPATWYNKGLCHYKKGDFVGALVCLKKAECDASWSELPDIYYTIDLIHKSLDREQHSSAVDSIYRVVVRALSVLTLYGWQLLFLLLWVILLFFAARLIRRQRYLSLTMLSLLVILSASALFMKHGLCNSQYGIVLKDNLVVYAGPDEAFHELGSLAQAHQVSICEHQDKWLKVRSGDYAGWVCDDNIALV